MATGSNIKSECYVCKKERVVYKCTGCSQDFCLNHLSEHNRELEGQLDLIEDQRNVFQQNLSQVKSNLVAHPLIQQINQWETNAIEKIQQTAKQQRDLVFQYTDEIKVRFDELTVQLKQMREEKDFNEITLNQLKNQFQQLENQLYQTPTISCREEPNTFISPLKIVQNNDFRWKSKANVLLADKLSNPTGIFIDNDDSMIYIADANNQRIIQLQNGKALNIVFEHELAGRQCRNSNRLISKVIIDKQTNSMLICDSAHGRIIRYGNQMETPIISGTNCFDIVLDNYGYLYTSDINKHEIKRWQIGDKHGTVVAGGRGPGGRLDQLKRPFYIFVDDEQSVYVSDCDNHRVVKWTKNAQQGIVVAGGNGEGNGLHQLSFPNGIFVDRFGNIFIADRNNHRVVRWMKNAQQGSVIVGGNRHGQQNNQMNRPSHLAFDRDNNLFVLDCKNDRLLKFDLDS